MEKTFNGKAGIYQTTQKDAPRIAKSTTNITDSRLGVAIVGCGYWGVNYVRVFNELSNAYIAGVCDQRTERLQAIKQRFPAIQTFENFKEVLAMDDVDAVVICTTAATHYPLVRQALEAGKHVMVEKPMTTSSVHGQELKSLAEAKHLTLMVGHTFVYNSGIRMVKECIKSVGQVYYLYARRTNLGPIRQDVNALWDLAPHDISIFNYWLDKVPEWVSAVGARVLRNGYEDVGFISLSYPDDIIAHIHASWAEPNKVRELVVVGSDQRISFNDLNPLEQVRVFKKGVMPVQREASNYGEHQFMMRDGDIVSPHVDVNEPLKTECQHFVDCVTRHEKPITGSKEGLDVVHIMEAIDQSVANKGTPIEVRYQ